ANGMNDSDPMAIFSHVISRINNFGLAYLHLVEGETGGTRELPEGLTIEALRSLFDGVYMANNGYNRNMAIEAITSGGADLIAFGRPFIANPDLVERLVQNSGLAEIDPATLYGGGAAGYTDYPTQNSAVTGISIV
ncbi:alkene reductase, partial [Alphaproteobacteria bacterium]|nr:alkene reductase [Alphaproteobacteria bacterium]